MKATFRVPAREQYGFLEIETEVESVEQAVEGYDDIVKSYNGGFGLEPLAFNKALDQYLTDGTGNTETYVAMSREQQLVFQHIKKAFKRLNKKTID